MRSGYSCCDAVPILFIFQIFFFLPLNFTHEKETILKKVEIIHISKGIIFVLTFTEYQAFQTRKGRYIRINCKISTTAKNFEFGCTR